MPSSRCSTDRRSRDECRFAGVYRTSCACVVDIRLRRGERFPSCHVCRRDVAWQLVEPLARER